MVCTVITYRARSAVREVAKALGFPLEAVDRVAKALDTRDASDVARDLALDGGFGWLFEEAGLDMAAEAIPPGRDGRGQTDAAAGSVTRQPSDSPWHGSARPALALPLRPDLADAEARARDASGDHDGRPYSESGWVPPRRPGVLDQSVVSVKYEGWEQKRYGPGGLKLPEPRDNGTPGPSSERPAVVRVDPESGMPIEERRRPASAAMIGAQWHRSRSRASDAEALNSAGGDPRDPGQRTRRATGGSGSSSSAREIDGFPRHLGIHVGGMLVTRTPLIDLVPIERATMPGRVVTQYDKEDIEALGLVKIDLLSLRTLGVVSECLDKIERDTGERIDLDALPHDDPEVFKTIRAADTVGMFQIESRAQMQALPKSRPERFEDLVVQVAIIRPGPIQGNAVHPYLRRRAGQEPVTYLHPSLQPILEDTLGVILYQEQVMQIAIEVCGYTALEADIFRKAMGSHRSHQKMQAERDRFVGGAMRTGLTEEDGEDLFKRCSAFAEFGFARAHAAAFAKITYDTAWLKQRYPAYYYAGVLNNQPMGFYSPAVIVGDAKRHGVKVLPVDVNRSRWEHEVEPIAGRRATAPATGDAPGQGDRREGARDARGRARHRSVHGACATSWRARARASRWSSG